MKHEYGFTLIELTVFIIVVAILGNAILSVFNTALTNSPNMQYQNVATQSVKKCIEGYLGKRYLEGYSEITNSTAPNLCNAPAGYTLSKTVANTTLYGESSPNYKTITVSVTGKGSATMSLIIAEY